MGAFDNARLVEARGMAILGPFLDETADGRLVLLTKGPLARALQETVGDAIFQATDGRAWSVEIKVEQIHTGNLFLESWSNRNLEDRARHVAVGSNPGWLAKLRSDLLLYYFLDADRLYAFDLFKLKRWAFDEWAITKFPEKQQRSREQMNDTRGWCVPLVVLAREVGYRLVHPKQLSLLDGENSPW
jgi:hypothetical protein